MSIHDDEDYIVRIECPYCYNFRDLVADIIYVSDKRIQLNCDVCHNPIYLEIVIPKMWSDRLGMNSDHLRIEDDE